MTFDELKPGILLMAHVPWDSWAIIKHKQDNRVTIDEYWEPQSGYLYMRYNIKKERLIMSGYKFATTEDAQRLIVAIFTKRLG